MAFIGAGLGTVSRTLPRTSRSICTKAPTMLAKGDKIPLDAQIFVVKEGQSSTETLGSIFASKKVALTTVPGALTPTCQDSHIPAWVAVADEFKAKGADEVVCMSVNDPFVVTVFEKNTGGAGKVTFLADGNAAVTKALGIDVDTGGFGGVRAMRGSYLVEDGVFTEVNLENGTSYEGAAKPETVLAQM